MKLNSGLVASILALCAVTCVADIPMEKYNGDVARAFHEALTPEANSLLTDLFGVADESKQAVYFGADDPRWKACGFSNMDEDERMIFRRLYRSYANRELALTESALVVSPVAKKAPGIQIRESIRKIQEKQKQQEATEEAVEWLQTADLSDLQTA